MSGITESERQRGTAVCGQPGLVAFPAVRVGLGAPFSLSLPAA